MPSILKDKKTFDALVRNPNHPAAPQVMGLLGVTSNDIKAAAAVNKIEQENPNDERIAQFRNKLFDKIARKRPAEESFFSAGGGFFNRLVAKNLIDQDPNVQAQYYAKKGFDTRFTKGNLEVKKPGDINFQPVDPDMIDIFDAFDLIGDVLEGAAVTAAGIGVGTATALTGPGAVAAGLGAAGITGAAFEAARQAGAQALGARDEFQAGPIGVAGTAGAVLPAALKGAGGALKGGGRLIGKTLSKIQGGLKKTAPEIKKAAEEIGAEATPGQLFDSRIVQELESAQYQSGGLIGGTGTRKQIKLNQQAAQDTADSIVEAASNRSSYDVGDKVGKQLAEGLAEKLKPAEAIYQKLESQFKRKAYKPDLKSFKPVFKKLKEDLKFDKKGLTLVKELEEQAKKIKSLTDLKKFRTALGNELSRAQGDKSISRVVGSLYGPTTQVRSNTLLRLAKTKGGDVFEAAKKDIETADAIYKKSIAEIENVILKPGKKIKQSPKKALDKFLQETPEIERINKILKTNDPKKIAGVKKAFPKVFEELRSAKIAEIADKSQRGGVVNPLKLVKKINAMPKETVNLIFGPNAEKKAKALQMFLESVPPMLGPSGTPRGIEVFRFRFLLDNLQSLRRDFVLNIRTKAAMDKGIFNFIGRALSSKRTQTGAVAGFRAGQADSAEPPLLPPQANKANLLP